MILRRIPWLALGLLFLVSSARAQQFLGYWTDAPGVSFTREFYVSPGGNNANGGTITSPFRTITFAISRATSPPWDRFPVTINVAPGLYDSTIETFPLSIPAHGITIESYQLNPANPAAVVVSSAGVIGGAATLVVPTLGRTNLPDSVIRGLELISAVNVIELRPTNAGAEEEVAVQVRNCTIMNPVATGNGIAITVQPNTNAYHVIDDNDFESEIDEEPVTRAAINVVNTANMTTRSSTLIRSNRIRLYQTGIAVTGGTPANCRPRICSNFVMQSIINVGLTGCNAIVLNNTIAFAMNFGMLPVVGFGWVGGSALTLSNNNIWNPPTPGGGAAADVVLLGLPGAVVLASNNNDQDTTLANTFPGRGNRNVTPQFVGGNAHPGFALTDVHLAMNSLLIGQGLETAISSVQSTTVGGRRVRTDVNRDVDLDSRILRGVGAPDQTVEIGADEVRNTRLARFVNAANPLETLDNFGNLRAWQTGAGNASWRTQVTITGQVGEIWVLHMGTAFFPTTGMPVVENDRVYQNVTHPFGSLMIEAGVPGGFRIAAGVIPAGGSVNVLVDFGSQLVNYAEAETHLQAALIDPITSAGRFTNRYLIDLNE